MDEITKAIAILEKDHAKNGHPLNTTAILRLNQALAAVLERDRDRKEVAARAAAKAKQG